MSAYGLCRSLVERLSEPLNRVRAMDAKYLNTEEAQKILRVCDELITSMQLYEKEKIDVWCSKVSLATTKASIDRRRCLQVELTSSEKLQQSVVAIDDLAKGETGLDLLRVNFDPKLVLLLRETKYLLSLKVHRIPQQATLLFQQVDRNHRNKIEIRLRVLERSISPTDRKSRSDRRYVEQSTENASARRETAARWEARYLSPSLGQGTRCSDMEFGITRRLHSRSSDPSRHSLREQGLL